MLTMLHVDKEEIAEELSQIFPPRLVQDVTLVKPVTTGFAPDPYAPIVIGDPEAPL